MRLIVTRAAMVALVLLALQPAAHAQFDRVPGAVKNIELGYGYSKTWAELTRKEKTIRPSDGKVYDTTTKMDVSSKFGFSSYGGTIIPLRQLGRKSMLALGVNLIYNGYVWDYPTLSGASLTDTGIHYTYGLPFSGATLNAGLGLSADFKFGTDAMMDKRYRWSWTGGIGVLPSVSMTSDFDNIDMTFGVQPFVKTEVGIFGGILWKIRLMYAVGNLKYIDGKPQNGLFPNSSSTTQLIGKGNFTVGLVVMPLSFMYKKSSWYNSY
jgi:hypothetical protein